MPTLPIPTLSTSYRDPLRSVHGSPRVAKIDHRSLHYQQHQHQRESSSETAIPYNRRRSSSSSLQHQPLYDTTNANNTNDNTIYEDSSANSHRWQSSPSPPSSPRGRYGKSSSASPRRISLATSPRSNGRLPSLFDRIKAALEAPKRPTVNTSPLPPIRTNLNLAQLSEHDDLAGCSAPTTTATTTTMPYSHLHPNFADSHLLDETNDLPSFWCPSMVARPTLFGIPCTEASRKAYSRHSSDVKASFQKLQLKDRGAVENRTIAFSTHLTISRWEPMPPSATINTAATASTKNPIASSTSPSITAIDTSSASTLSNSAEEQTSSSESVTKQQQIQTKSKPQTLHGSYSVGTAPFEQPPLQPQRDNPVYAARLISLANYIRHIISLSSGNSPLHSQSTLVQQRLLASQCQQQQQLLQQQRQQQKLQESRPSWTTANRPQQDLVSLPSPLSAGPGPMKNNSLSTRRHRQISEYYDHAARRQLHHQQQQVQSSALGQDAQGFLQRPDPTQALPSPTSPIFQVGRRRSSQPQQQQQQQQQSHNTGSEQSAAAAPLSGGSILALTLPKVPFPNLTLTLALIYVDRLKEKNPAAKGEQGCSHRLFLVAYIIAAKYRCSVELATLLQEQYRSDVTTTNATSTLSKETFDQSEKGDSVDNKDVIRKQGGEGEEKSIDQRICEARSRAEVILSNQAWVQLLSLGSFMRPTPSPSTSATTATAVAARTSSSQPMNQPIGSNATGTLESGSGVEAKPLPIQSTPLSTNDGANVAQTQTPPSSNSTSPSTPSPPSLPSSVLQVEDLDRMESEFLTFLDYDLTARSQDLDTCWGLLVGNMDI
ncbi:hypothetical protein BG015_002163 [Linnemannia schmuckeri]|uniref:Cyclin N-terminal domain-containing protein n=1 Tax=Linnemannia schmuckeri TaxID=64567 RepID=A0A9P5RNW0_9FUNG|nr:hypothetical protein BG015_002163 [Linnemannia schmuckeri]